MRKTSHTRALLSRALGLLMQNAFARNFTGSVSAQNHKTLSSLHLVIFIILFLSSTAHAQFATGGSGLHKERIFWINWGTVGENVINGKIVVQGFNIDSPATPANRLDISCTLSDATSPSPLDTVSVYTPGTWRGDGLDDLYNIGGFNFGGIGGNPNTLSVALISGANTSIEFNLACGASLGGVAIPLSGLVFADAEASGATEYVGVRLTAGGRMRVIDQISSCGSSSTVEVDLVGGAQQYKFGTPTSPQEGCENNPTPALRSGPNLVGFMEGATSGRVLLQGVSAIAVGAVLEFDRSEAIPASYGVATHLLTPTWSGGEPVLPVNNNAVGINFNAPENLATLSYGAPLLGASVAPDGALPGPLGGPDVDALPKTSGPLGSGYAAVPPPTIPSPGSLYSIAGISCTGPGAVVGWIDFNGNGVFDIGEKSSTAICPVGPGSVSLGWIIPPDYLPQSTSYLRLRTTSNATGLGPTGAWFDGEAEDYRMSLPASSDLQAQNLAPATADPGEIITVTGLCTNAGPTAADSPTCAVSGLPVGVVATCTPAPGPTLGVGSVISCSATFASPASGSMTIVTTASSGSPDALPFNNVASSVITITEPQADMRAAIAGPASVQAGNAVTVSGTCTNAGPVPAGGAGCALSGLPAGATSSCTPAPLPALLAVNSSIVCTSTFTPLVAGPLHITAVASSSTADPAPANNTATLAIAVTPAADMAVTMQGIPANPTVGTVVSATITCTNQGPSPAVNARCLLNGMPPGATYTCVPASPGPLAAGASLVCSLVFTLHSPTAVTLQATAASDTFDPNASNNHASAALSMPTAVPVGGILWLALMMGGIFGVAFLRRLQK